MEITENKLKEILSEQRNEYQHFMGVMKEDIQSNVQLIAEQYQDIKDDISIIKTDIQFIKSSLKKKVDYDEFEELARRVSLLESKARK